MSTALTDRAERLIRRMEGDLLKRAPRWFRVRGLSDEEVHAWAEELAEMVMLARVMPL